MIATTTVKPTTKPTTTPTHDPSTIEINKPKVIQAPKG